MKQKAKVKYSQNKTALFFLWPWILGLIIFTIGPMLISLYYSFTEYNLLSAPRWIGLENYKTMFFGDPLFLTSLTITLKYVVIAVPLKLLAALGVALLLEKGKRGLGIYRTIYYIPSLLGASVAVAMLWRQIFGINGLINQLLSSIFGMQGLPNWVGNPDYALYTLIILFFWQFGSPMIIFLASLKQVPTEYYEATLVDGAGCLKRFWHITLPEISPIIFFNLIMQMITAFQSFTSAYVISNGTGGPVNSTMLYSLYLYQKAFSFQQMGYASAMAWVLLIIIGVITLLIFRSSRLWVHYSDGGI